jgi:uncharacterized protein YxjI
MEARYLLTHRLRESEEDSAFQARDARAITNTDLSVLDGSGESLVKIGDEILRVLDAHA